MLNDPFPHAVLDGFWPDDLIDRVAAEIPDPNDKKWISYSGEEEQGKLCNSSLETWGEASRELADQLLDPDFISFLSDFSGIELVYGDFLGGGYHQVVPGGRLGIHADFNTHPQGYIRRLNLLVYLNRGWKEEWGGHLELWNKDMTECSAKLAPLANRTVMFVTSDHSFHGHPHPLACPEGVTRKSFACYYYSAPDANVPNHSTLFQKPKG